jgi:EAL domain-containing protein (putative c-di-GMP-specific phosphodiesterase class I)
VARLDGLCFAVLPAAPLPEPEAVRLGRHLAEAVDEPLVATGRAVALTTSVGVAEVRPDVSAAGALQAADVAAHRAQASGGDRVVCHLETMTAEAHNAVLQTAKLRDVVKNNDFALIYQSVFDASTRQPVAVEALVRFAPDESPYPLILLAERNGLIIPLGSEILRRACTEFMAWPRGDRPIVLQVNVSACQLVEAAFCSKVLSTLERTGVHPDQLMIEVTETAARDPESAKQIFTELRSNGIRIALDDFGTGFSSLATLDRLPIDEVKLDRSFTQSLAVSHRTEGLVGATIALAHSLGLAVVAEGVEDEDQLALLVELGCDKIQGYLLHRPAPLISLDL